MATTPKIRYDIEAAVTGGGDVEALATSLEGLAGTLEGDLKTQATAAAAALRELGAKQGAIENFRELKGEVSSAAARLREAQTAAQALGSQLGNTAPTRAQAGQMQKLRDDVRAAKLELQGQTVALDQSRASLRAAGISTDTLAQSERNIRAAIAASRAEVEALAPAYNRAGAAAQTAGQKQAAATAQAGAGLRGLGDQLRTIQSIALTALGGSFIGSLARDVSQVADEYNNLGARIKIVTGEGAAFDAAFAGVKEIALATNSELDATATLFTRIAQAGAEIGVSNQQALALTQTINQAIQLSGGSAESAKAAIIQLVQGLQSGVLRGEEFNSVMEQSPRLARALADGLGVGIGQLRAMAQQGKLTSETVINALRGQSDAVASEFAKLPPTVGRALQNLSTNWTNYVGEVDKATSASTAAAEAINSVGQNLDGIVGASVRAASGVKSAWGIMAGGANGVLAAIYKVGEAFTGVASNIGQVTGKLSVAWSKIGFGDAAKRMREEGEQLIESSEALWAASDALAQKSNESFVAMAEYAQTARDGWSGLTTEIETGTQAINKSAGATSAAQASAAEGVNLFAGAAKNYAVQVGKAAEAQDALRIARSADAQVALSSLQTGLELARQSEAMALLLGREKDAHAAKVEQIKIEIQITQAKTEVARAEAQGSIAVAQAKLEELRLSGEINAVKEAELQASIRLAQAKLAEAEAVGKSVAIQQKQLEILSKAGAGLSNYSDGIERATGRQREFAGATRESSSAIAEQALAMQKLAVVNARYASPLGAGKYSSPLDNKYGSPRTGQSNYGNTREERLGGQSASDETLRFALLDKLNKGQLTEADVGALKNVVSSLRENQTMFDALGIGTADSSTLADDRKWQAIQKRFEQAIATFEGPNSSASGAAAVGRTVNVNLSVGGQTKTVPTTEAGAENLLSALKNASISAGR